MNALAELIDRQFQAAALWHDDLVKAVGEGAEKIEAVVQQSITERNSRHDTLVDYLRQVRDGENAADRLAADMLKAILATTCERVAAQAEKLRQGESIMPPAANLSDPVVNTAAVVDPPMVPRLLPDEMPAALHAVEPVEATRTDPQPETLAA